MLPGKRNIRVRITVKEPYDRTEQPFTSFEHEGPAKRAVSKAVEYTEALATGQTAVICVLHRNDVRNPVEVHVSYLRVEDVPLFDPVARQTGPVASSETDPHPRTGIGEHEVGFAYVNNQMGGFPDDRARLLVEALKDCLKG